MVFAANPRAIFAATILALVFAGAGCSAAPAGDTAAALSARPPNVILLFADDLGYGDLGSYGHPYHRTPNLDALAREGQRWTDFYVAAPVCSPSRGALLTGRLPNRTGLYGRRVPVLFPNDGHGIPAAEVTLPERLSAVGYRTAIIGKWHLGDQPDSLPTRHGFDEWFGLPYSNDMRWEGGPSFPELAGMMAAGQGDRIAEVLEARQRKYLDPKNEYWNVPLLQSRREAGAYADRVLEPRADQATLTRRYTQEALRFIDAHQAQPFFLYLPYTMPHTPLFRDARFENRSLGGRYGDVIEEIDWSVGEIVARLRALSLAEDTLVIFTSDNGPWLAMQHHGGSSGLLRDGKGTTFEGGMRVPAIFWGPGRVQPGAVSDPGSALDLYPTIAQAAGATEAIDSDGYDLGPTLRAGQPSPRRVVTFYRAGELQALREGRYKLRLVSEGAYGLGPPKTVHEAPQLYDLQVDPGERYNIAERHPEIVARLQQTVAAHRAGMADAAPLFDQRFAPAR
jgi:uncharacterized sulfatase